MLLINVKMLTVVGILTSVSRINYWILSSEPLNSIYMGYFSIYEQLNFKLSCVEHEKFYNLGTTSWIDDLNILTFTYVLTYKIT